MEIIDECLKLVSLMLNGDEYGSFLQYFDVHSSKMDYRKEKKNAGWGLGIIHWVLIEWRQI